MSRDTLGTIDHQSEQYRRGQVLGFTMAEIILVLLFLLLLLLGSKIERLSEQLMSAFSEDSPEYASAENLSEELVQLKGKNIISSDKDVEWLSERLVLVAEAAITAGGNLQIEDMDIIDGLKNRVDDLMSKSQVLSEENTALREELSEAVSLQAQLSLDQELIGIVKDRGISSSEVRQCLLNCGGGPNACWGESLARPDFIYNIALYDKYVVVSPDSVSVGRNSADWNSLPPESRIEVSTALSTTDFRRAFGALSRYAKSNDCVFQTRVVDKNTESKESYKQQKKLVDDYTYSSIFKDWIYGSLPAMSESISR